MRRLAPDDWELLRVLRLAALLDAPQSFASTHERERADAEEQWRERARWAAWFAVCVDGEAVGLAGGAGSPDGLAGRRHLVGMWVHPEHRGSRLASVLVEAVREWAVADGAQELALWVADGNAPAARAYSRAGFVPTGRRQPLPSNPAVGEEHWLLDLSR